MTSPKGHASEPLGPDGGPSLPFEGPERPPSRGRWYDVGAWLALVTFVVAVVGTSLVGRTTFFATDLIENLDPWRSVDPAYSQPLNSWLGDTVDTVGPSNALAAGALAEGDFAQWNPFVAGGSPLLPLPDGGSLSPLTAPWYLVPLPFAPGLVKLLEIVTVTVGMSLLGRRWGTRSGSWALAALVFSSSGYMIAWTNWQQTRVAAFIPLLIWVVDRIVTRSRLVDLVPVALVTGAMISGGYPAVAGWALFAAGAYLVVRLLASRVAPRQVAARLGIALLGVVGGLVILAWQLVPFTRTTLAVVDMDARRQAGGHLEWWSFAGAVLPETFGGPITNPLGLGLNPIETLSYLGAAVVAVIVAGAVFRIQSERTRGVGLAVYGGLTLSIVLIHLGGPLLDLAQALPVFSTTAIPRFRVILALFAALAVLIGFDALVSRALGTATGGGNRGWPRLLVGSALGAVLVAFVAAGVLESLRRVPEDLQTAAITEIRGLAATWAVVAVLAVLAVVVRGHRSGAVVAGLASVVVPALVVLPAAQMGRGWWPQADPAFFYRATPTHEFLIENLGHDRYASVDWTMMPGASTAFEMRSVNGHAFHSPAWRELLEAVDPDVMRSRTYSTLSPENLPESLTSPVLDRLAVRYVVTAPAQPAEGRWDGAEVTGTKAVEDGAALAAPVRGPFRAVAVPLPAGLAVDADYGAVVEVTVTVAGEVVAEVSQAIERSRESGRLVVAVPGETVAADETARVQVTFHGLPAPAEIGTGPGGVPVLDVQRPPVDDTTVVATGGAVVIERESALPRIRWASGAEVREDPADRVAVLAAGTLPDDVVVLSGAAGSGGGDADVRVVEDAYDRIVVQVDADGPGWLVVADNLSGVAGWTATVDGVEVELLGADHVGGAVHLGAGIHEVELSFTAPGLEVGLAISAAGLLAIGLVLLLDRRRSRARS